MKLKERDALGSEFKRGKKMCQESSPTCSENGSFILTIKTKFFKLIICLNKCYKVQKLDIITKGVSLFPLHQQHH